MTDPKKIADGLRRYNAWRRNNDEDLTVEMPDPKELGIWIDSAIAVLDAHAENNDLAQGVEDGHIKRAWKRFSDEFFRGPDAPYPGMIDAFEKHYGQSWGDREWRDEARTWAAAWKAAVHHASRGDSTPEAGDCNG